MCASWLATESGLEEYCKKINVLKFVFVFDNLKMVVLVFASWQINVFDPLDICMHVCRYLEKV